MKKSKFYNDYKKARDKAWDIIIDYNVSSLPVDVFNLCKRMGIHTVSYEKAAETIQLHSLSKYTIDNDGFTVILNGHYVIFYDDTIQPIGRMRFTLAHELGHIVLGHLLTESVSCRSGITLWNNGETQEPNDLEKSANIFSSRLLSPACVLRALNIHKPKDIANLCGLSDTAAKVRAARMAKLYKRESEWFEKHNKSCFGLSVNERLALKQFSDFIHNVKTKDK